MIESTLLNRLTSALVPHMNGDRRAILTAALDGDDLRDTIINAIDLTIADPFDFTRRMLQHLDTYEIDGAIIGRVLTHVATTDPSANQTALTQLRADVIAFYAADPDPETVERHAGSSIATLITDPDDIPDVPDLTIGLIGREILQNHVRYIIDTGRRAVVYGQGGTGKTALVSQVVYDWMLDPQNKHRADCKVLYVRAGSTDANGLLSVLIYPFDPRAAASADDKPATLRGLLRSHGVNLVFIDDAWNLAAINGMRRALPRSVPLVVTTRQRRMVTAIPGIEPIHVPDMEPAKAQELMRRIASLVDHTETPELCADLSHMAYMVRVAAITMQKHGLNAAEMRQRIADRRELVNLPDEFGEAHRETLAALVETSLEALDDDARRVFMATGAFFAPTITAEMLDIYLNHELVRDSDRNGAWKVGTFHEMSSNVNIDPAITQLVEHGIFTRIAETDIAVASYRSHDLAHAYAETHTTDDIKRRAVQTCIAYTENYDEPSLDNFKALQPELPNFDGASAWALDHEMWAETEQFAWNLYMGSEITDYRGLYNDAMRLLTRAATAAERGGIQRNHSSHLSHIGLIHNDLGSYRQAIQFYEKALEIQETIGNQQLQGNQLGNLGLAYYSLGELVKAIAYHERSLAIKEEIGDRRGQGNSLGNLGSAYRKLGEYQKAIEYYERALAIDEQTGDQRGQGATLGNLGNAYADLGEVEKAIDYYERSLAIQVEIGDRLGQGNQLNNLGAAYYALELYDTAIDYFERSLVIKRVLGNPHHIARTERNLASAKAARDGQSS